MYFDWTYLIIVSPALFFAMWASARVKTTFKKYSRYQARLTGAQAAKALLDSHGIYDVRVEPIAGELTDYYDPTKKVVKLSVYNDNSIAAVGVACHEVGHAIQHAEGYVPVKIRSAIVPVTNFGSKISVPMILLGLILSSFAPELFVLVYVGIACFGLAALFQLVTLPVEFNASRRAIKAIEAQGLLQGAELTGAEKVLGAAALTYVAALAVSLAQLLRMIILFAGRRD